MLNNAQQIASYPEAVEPKKSTRPLSVDATAFSRHILNTVQEAMDGPNGVAPVDLIAALGALAGYSARWLVIRQIIEGAIEDDFEMPKGCNMPFVSHSDHVGKLVSDLKRDSFAGVLTKSMVAAGANWLPDVSANVNHNFASITDPVQPDYTVDEAYWPQVPPQSSLLMMWETQARLIAHTAGASNVAVQAYALAITQSAMEFKEELPLEQAAQLALESAIAMSRIEYAF